MAFQDYLGLPSLSLEFAAFTNYGAYHSDRDTRPYMTTHGDPRWRYPPAPRAARGGRYNPTP